MSQKVKFARQRAHTTEKEKQRKKQGPTVTSARLSSECPCCSLAATCGHHGGIGLFHTARTCKRGEIVQGDEGPVGGVAQVVCHGVIVVVGHQEEGQEEKGEKQGEVKGEVEQLREKRSSWIVWRWGDKRVNGLEPCGV